MNRYLFFSRDKPVDVGRVGCSNGKSLSDEFVGHRD